MAKQRKAPAKKVTKGTKPAPKKKPTKAAAPKKTTAKKSKPKAKVPWVQLPEYAHFIHGDGREVVMSTPAWFDKYDDKDNRIATVLVDAHAWPPKIVEHAMRTSAAARLPDGRWACTAMQDEGWCIVWFANIAAKKPTHSEPVPFEVPPPAATDDDPPQDPGPIARLHAFADTLLAISFEGAVHARVGGGPWREQPGMRGKSHAHARNEINDGTEYLEWNGALYDSELRPVDALDCTHFVSRGDRVFAIHHGTNLVELDRGLLGSRLSGHTVAGLERGPRDTLILTLHRDDDRGTQIDRAIYDPVANTVGILSRELVGATPLVVACTDDGDLVLHADREHRLEHIAATRLATVAMIAATDLPASPKRELAPLDNLGASSRSLVATAGDSIVVALDRALRVHSLDTPKAVVELARPIVAVAARGSSLAALDDAGVLHTYTSGGDHVASVPTVITPRSLAVGLDAWIVVGAERIVVVGEETFVIDIAGALAVAVDPETDEVLIACEDHRLACWSRAVLRDLPPTIEQIVAVAAFGGRRFACEGVRDLYLLDLAMPELIRLDVRGRRPHLAATGSGRVAICETAGSVHAYDLEGVALVAVDKGAVHYSSYSTPDDREITVHGLAFMDDGRLVVLLDEGRANIVNPDTGAALKLDSQPGDPASSWVFITGAGILMAG